MLREPTIEKLQTLRLRVLARTWLEQDHSADTLALSFDERLALLVDAEMLARHHRLIELALAWEVDPLDARLGDPELCFAKVARETCVLGWCDNSPVAAGWTSIRP
ncbi:MAG: ATP-binding protein [Polyangiaceae bacterium]|jgi:hypothetical protein